MTTNEKHKPEAVIRDGNLKAVIWKNAGENSPFYSIDFYRTYKAGEQFRDSRNFGERDLVRLGQITDLARAKVLALRGTDEAVT